MRFIITGHGTYIRVKRIALFKIELESQVWVYSSFRSTGGQFVEKYRDRQHALNAIDTIVHAINFTEHSNIYPPANHVADGGSEK